MQYPRVSNVLDVINWGYGDVPKDVLQKAANFGTGFHNVAAKATIGVRTRVNKKYKTRLESLRGWIKDSNLTVVEVEKPIKWEGNHNGPKGYVGTCDALLRYPNGHLLLVDYKTGRVTYRHYLQLTGYKMALEQMGFKIDKMACIKPTWSSVDEFESPYLPDRFLNLLDWYYELHSQV